MNTKFANTLVELEVLGFYDRPLEILVENELKQKFIILAYNFTNDRDYWLVIPVADDDLTRLFSNDITNAISMRDFIITVGAYRSETTESYLSLTEGVFVKPDGSEDWLPLDGSYLSFEAYQQWTEENKK